MRSARAGVAGLVGVVVAVSATVGVLSPSPSQARSAPTCTLPQVVRTWSVRRLARQTVVVPVRESDVNTVSAQVRHGVGGVILFGSSAPASLGADLARLLRQAPAGVPPLVMTDEEGGAVQRMANLVGDLPSARRMARRLTPAQVRRRVRHVAERMAAVHVTMDLAPVLDLDDRPGPSATNPDGTRSFGIDPAVASTYGLAFARGLRDAGVVPVVKHFPGLGHATGNTDVAPADTLPWSRLQRAGLLPFEDAVHAGLPVMVSNARVPGLTNRPASLSSAVVHRVLRTELGFHGLVMTDSLTAGAVGRAGYGVRAAAVRALEVGEDLVLFNADPDRVAAVERRVVRGIVAAVDDGDLPLHRLRTAAVHVLRTKDARVCG